ncbi:MAG: hypothetical protein J7K82_02935, partial [Thermoproteales archaeon]|nr:hypothetical protein [Thermoproteales archaeon]
YIRSKNSQVGCLVMVSAFSLASRILLQPKGNIVKIKFSVDERKFKAFIYDDAIAQVVREILLDRCYEFLPEFELKNFKGKRVVDGGAHVGLYSLVASAFAKEVISLEPHPITFRILEINKIINNAKNIITKENCL